MPSMSASKVKLFIGFILANLLLLFIILYLRNGTTMVVTIDTPAQSPLNTKIYYTDGTKGYSEHDTLSPFTIKKNKYYYTFPKLSEVKQLRFDPHNHTASLTIKEMKIIRYHYLKKSIYILPLQNFKSGAQITDYKATAKGISLKSIGNDPNISTLFLPKKVFQGYQFPIYQLVLTVLMISILFYLYHLYRTESLNESLTAKLILYTLFLSFIFFKTTYYKEHVRFGYPPDEIMHFSYVQYVDSHHAIVPDFKKMPHYLSHPSLYYELIDLAYDKDASKKQNIENFRSLSTLIYLATLMLIFYLGFSSRLSILGHFVYLTFISAIPMHAYLGSSITNDTLAMFGAAVFIVGGKRLIEKNYDTLTYFIIGLGIFLSFFSKLTVALLLFFAIVFFLMRMVITKEWIKINRLQMILLALFLVPIVYYQISIILEYHALVPTYDHTHPEAYLKSGFYVPEALRQHLSPYQWFERMVHYIQGGWFGIHSHHSFGHPSWSGVSGLIALHLFAIIALFMPCAEDKKTFCILGKLSLLAVFSVLIVQYFFSYKAHVAHGYLGGLQPRYLLPFMFAFAIMASLFVERFKNVFVVTILIILLCIHALYSDFFYFLTNYA